MLGFGGGLWARIVGCGGLWWWALDTFLLEFFLGVRLPWWVLVVGFGGGLWCWTLLVGFIGGLWWWILMLDLGGGFFWLAVEVNFWWTLVVDFGGELRGLMFSWT